MKIPPPTHSSPSNKFGIAGLSAVCLLASASLLSAQETYTVTSGNNYALRVERDMRITGDLSFMTEGGGAANNRSNTVTTTNASSLYVGATL